MVQHSKLYIFFIALILLSSKIATAEKSTVATVSDETKVVQADIRKLSTAVYKADIDTVLKYTHPKIKKILGGEAKAKKTLDSQLKKFKSLGMKQVLFKFPAPPRFVDTSENHYVVIPTYTVMEVKGQRVESLNFQFGVKPIKGSAWTYIEGSRLNKKTLPALFPDFPDDFELPKFWRKKL